MDAFACYHQIAMHKDDQNHTYFLTEKNVYCSKGCLLALKTHGNISEAGQPRICWSNWKNHRGLHRRSGSEMREKRGSTCPSRADVCNSQKFQHETHPKEVQLKCWVRKVLRPYGELARNRNQPIKDKSHCWYECSPKYQGGATINKMFGGTKQVHLGNGW